MLCGWETQGHSDLAHSPSKSYQFIYSSKICVGNCWTDRRSRWLCRSKVNGFLVKIHRSSLNWSLLWMLFLPSIFKDVPKPFIFLWRVRSKIWGAINENKPKSSVCQQWKFISGQCVFNPTELAAVNLKFDNWSSWGHCHQKKMKACH